MAVRVPVKIILGEKEEIVPALVNSGFETYDPVIILPFEFSKKIGANIKTEKVEEFRGAGNVSIPVYPLGKVKVKVTTEDRESKIVEASAFTIFGEDEVLLSDGLSGDLEIAIEDLKRGYWRFWGENKIRESVEKLSKA
jgi:hypothetical protein